MNDFELLLSENRMSVERYIKFRLPSLFDAEDVIQEVYIAAFREFDMLKNKDSFKAWLIGIARNKCNEYFRKKAKILEIPIDALNEKELYYGRHGVSERLAVKETLRLLGDKDQQILYLYFWEEMPQADIAARLNIPIGTVKSRLYTAKQNFKNHYPYPIIHSSKGEFNMKKLPEFLPEYTIKESEKQPFEVRHEELPGMLIVPRKKEKLSFGIYDFPSKKLSGVYHLEVVGDMVLHGIHGVEIDSLYIEKNQPQEKRTIFAQLTDSHCRYLGGMSTDSAGTRRILTFLDGEEFSDSYEIGKDNCGFEVNRTRKGIIKVNNGEMMTTEIGDVSDIVARYDVSINGRTYDTVKLVDMQVGNQGCMMCEYYLDRSGKTVLWRRFNRNDWAHERYQKNWSDMLPENEQIVINGEVYVHWYDCITDYIL